jgi:NAD(P)-dependent dehydrogenase (short-subunit alcohol dehydrogenase family)
MGFVDPKGANLPYQCRSGAGPSGRGFSEIRAGCAVSLTSGDLTLTSADNFGREAILATQKNGLADKHVVIVGGSSGMGLALGRQAAAAGARVTLSARDADKLAAAARQVAGAAAQVMDLRRTDTISAAIPGFGTVDHLVITAGTYRPGPADKIDVEEWRGVLEERIIGPLFLIKSLARQITTSVVMFTGTASMRPTAGIAAAAAAIAGVENMVRCLALELSPVRINVVVPGMVDTPLLDSVLPADSKQKIMTDFAAHLPAKVVGTPDDAAQAALFLMTNPFMSGSTVVLDGGGLLV